MKIKSIFLFTYLIIALLITSGCVGLGGNVGALRLLVKLGQNDKLKQQTIKQETENFRKIKDYINSNKIEKGMSSELAVKKFGKPILVLSDSGAEKWSYKPSDADWIGGEKIYLFFNNEDKLFDWECVNCK